MNRNPKNCNRKNCTDSQSASYRIESYPVLGRTCNALSVSSLLVFPSFQLYSPCKRSQKQDHFFLIGIQDLDSEIVSRGSEKQDRFLNLLQATRCKMRETPTSGELCFSFFGISRDTKRKVTLRWIREIGKAEARNVGANMGVSRAVKNYRSPATTGGMMHIKAMCKGPQASTNPHMYTMSLGTASAKGKVLLIVCSLGGPDSHWLKSKSSLPTLRRSLRRYFFSRLLFLRSFFSDLFFKKEILKIRS